MPRALSPRLLPLLPSLLTLALVAAPALGQQQELQSRGEEQTTPADAPAQVPAASPALPAASTSPSAPAGGPDASVEEILVTGTAVSDAIDQARFAESVVDVLSAEDFATTGDSSVVDALSRVTGVTAVDGKYVYVRGLGERYSNTLFNGGSLPSPDPVRRVVPLNLFPSGVMDQLSVQKTYAPWLPADFAGGSVQLTTRAVPSESEFHFDFTLKTNTRTTGKKTPWFEGGGADWTGFDDGFRDMPKGLRGLDQASPGATPQERQALGLAVDRSFDVSDKTLPPGFQMTGSYANRWRTRIGAIGVVLGAQGENNWQYKESKADTQDGGAVLRSPLTRKDTTNSVEYAGLGSINWTPATSQLVKATLFWSHLTDKRYIEEDPRESFVDEAVFRDVYAEWEEQSLLTTQLSGSHEIERLHDLLFDWTTTYSHATRVLPDGRFYGFRYFDDDFTDGTDPDSLRFNRAANNVRSWQDLTDDAWDVVANAALPLRLHDSVLSTLRTGVKYFNKQRDSEFLQYRYVDSNTGANWPNYNQLPVDEIFGDDNIRPEVWSLQQFSRADDQYEAEEEIVGGYLQSDFELGSKLRLMVGTRYESSTQTIDTDAPDPATSLEDDRFFPATELTWFLRDDLQLRAAWSQTLNRPDLRELSPSSFIHPESRRRYFGNPDLEIAELTNYDVRLEWYHGTGNSIELAGFYKDIQNPVQEYELVNGRSRTWRNAEEAYLWGVELAAQQSLAVIGKWADDFTARTNVAYIQSEATEAADAPVTNRKHPLQGQSDYIFNFQITHDYLPWDLKNTLAFNLFGERLSAIGAQDPNSTTGNSDIYEKSRPTLDFTLQWGFVLFDDDYALTLKARNLLDPKYSEDAAAGSVLEYRMGRDISLQVGRDF
ncbi:MAG: TonB-dependent receptor domain-containing protein [Candidatus Binatia bacterium]